MASQQKIAVAQQNGYFNEEIAPVTVTNRKGKAEPKSVRTSADLVTMTVDQQVMCCSHLYSHNSEEVFQGRIQNLFFFRHIISDLQICTQDTNIKYKIRKIYMVW